MEKERMALLPLDGIEKYAGVRHAQRIEYFDRADDAPLVAVQAVVVGRYQQVETGLPDSPGKGRRCGKTRITRIRRCSDRGFEVGDGQVGRPNLRGDVAKTLRVIVLRAVPLRRDQLRLVLHDVAGKEHAQGIRLSLHPA